MYKSLEQALLDLEKAGMLKRIHAEVDPHLEMAEIARENFRQGGPALLFEHVKGSKFRAACNIFGSDERFNFLFRDGFEQTKTAIQFKSNFSGTQTLQNFGRHHKRASVPCPCVQVVSTILKNVVCRICRS